jgi:hypothetical protein
LIEKMHKLPEWEDPGDRSKAIDPMAVLNALKKSRSEIALIADHAAESAYLGKLFGPK